MHGDSKNIIDEGITFHNKPDLFRVRRCMASAFFRKDIVNRYRGNQVSHACILFLWVSMHISLHSLKIYRLNVLRKQILLFYVGFSFLTFVILYDVFLKHRLHIMSFGSLCNLKFFQYIAQFKYLYVVFGLWN